MTRHIALLLLVAGTAQAADPQLIGELDASAPRTGYLELEKTPVEVLGDTAARQLNPVLLESEKIEWRVYVPRGYDPARPPGLLVFVSSIEWGGIPDEWRPLMDEKNLIWIGASSSGSSAPVQQRMAKAIIAPRAISRDYTIDASRTYIAGFDDGGMVANLVQTTEPGLFRGGIYICGAMFWGDRTPSRLDQIRNNSHVFIRGCVDPKERRVRTVYEQFLDAGIESSKLITVHPRRRRLPNPAKLESAIDFLDNGPQQ